MSNSGKPVALSVFRVGGESVGKLIPAVQAALLHRVGSFGLTLHTDGSSSPTLGLGHRLSTPQELQQCCQALAADLHNAGYIAGWRNELFTLKKPDGSAWFDLERASFRTFGFESEAVHIHGHTQSGQVWLGRRSTLKAIDPGLLDNLAAGGLSSGETPVNCARRELWEEAGVDEVLSKNLIALPKTLVSERIETQGVHRELLHCFSLQLPADFTPENKDGEVSGFMRCSLTELRELLSKKALTTDAAICTEYAVQCAAVLDKN